jgi:hypothetical protein
MRRLSVLLACVVMALTLIAVAAGVSAAAPKQQPPGPNDFYGVLYSSDTLLHWETGASKASADQAASALCEAANDGTCVFEVWVYNGWAAYTQGEMPDGTIRAWASWDRTEQKAAAHGIAACEDAGATGCKALTYETAFDANKRTRGGFK